MTLPKMTATTTTDDVGVASVGVVVIGCSSRLILEPAAFPPLAVLLPVQPPFDLDIPLLPTSHGVVGDCVGDDVGDCVGDGVGDSVGQASMAISVARFTNSAVVAVVKRCAQTPVEGQPRICLSCDSPKPGTPTPKTLMPAARAALAAVAVAARSLTTASETIIRARGIGGFLAPVAMENIAVVAKLIAVTVEVQSMRAY